MAQNTSTANTTNKSTNPDPFPLLSNNLDTLNSVRPKLVQMIDSIATLQAQIEAGDYYGGGPGMMMPYSELLSRFNVLVSHAHSLSSFLVPPPPLEDETRRQKFATNWEREETLRERQRLEDKTFANVLVHPATKEVEEERDWLVGALLRTKQLPDIESKETSLLSTLPSPISETLDSLRKVPLPGLAPNVPNQPEPEELEKQVSQSLDAINRMIRQYDDRVLDNLAILEAILQIEGSPEQEEVSEGQEDISGGWNWKQRYTDEEEGDEQEDDDKDEDDEGKEVEEMMMVDSGPDAKPNGDTTAGATNENAPPEVLLPSMETNALVAFMRDGRLPRV